MTRSERPSTLVILLALAGAACAVGPNYKRPVVPIPDRFYGEDRAAIADARSLADAPWWEVFDDPILKALIDEALRNGFDARIAAARVQEARAQYGIARSQLFPAVDYLGGWNRQRPDQIVNPSGSAQTRWTVDVGLSWELDLWGRVRRLDEAARAAYLATEEGRRGVMLSLSSDVAIAYLDLRVLDQQLGVARNTATAFEETLDLFRRRFEGGAASGLETARATALLAGVAAQVPEIERAIVARENRINFLLGRNPQPIPRDGPPMGVPPAVPPGLPSTLLERRPDIRQAEALVIAANAAVGVAKADFFPRLTLTGFFGLVSPELGNLFDSQSKTWGIGPSVLGPIFRGGRVKRNYEAAQARWEQARVSYEATTANAFGEVSRALVDRAKLIETERQRALQVAAYQEAVRLAQIRYSSGLSAYFEVLEAQQQLFPAELALAQARHDQLVAIVTLYRALGGGWQAAESSGRSEAIPVDPQLLQLGFERLPRYSESRRRPVGAGHASERLAQRALDDLFLARGEIRRERHASARDLGPRRAEPARVDGERLALTQDDGPLDHVLQLSNVPGPAILFEERQGLVADPADPLAFLLGIPFDQVLDEERDVTGALTQRRHVHREHVESVEQVLPKAALGDRRVQVPVGRGDDAHVDGDGTVPSHPFEFAFLQHAQQRQLHLRRKVSDLVEEESSTVGRFEAADAPLHRAREGALFVAEELRRDQ